MTNELNVNVEKILSEGLSLQNFGINNWGLTKEKALIAINELRNFGIPVLGGDVMKLENGEWIHTYDNWYCDKLPNESKEQFMVRSTQAANEYVNNYNINPDSETLFVIVAET
ncbi:MAG: Imm40 family immunity protein [Aridibacter sp.]